MKVLFCWFFHFILARPPGVVSHGGFRSYLTQDDVDGLIDKLRLINSNISSRYQFQLENDPSYIVHGHQFKCLTEKLTAAYFGRTELVVGITGGSSTQLSPSWPSRVLGFLTDLGLDVELRNAAQGSTSQTVTAPCIDQLVGAKVDLLLWEFAMNDVDTNIEMDFSKADNRPICDIAPVRCAAADAWVREAIRYGPSAIGFLHLWDILIHEYKMISSDVPDRAWKATNAAMQHYKSIYGSFFSVNVVRFIKMKSLFADKKQFLQDGHHPNSAGFDVASDLFLYAMIQNWINGLLGSDEPCLFHTFEEKLLQHSVLIGDRPTVYPQQHQRVHCIMAPLPQFGSYSAIRFGHSAQVLYHTTGKVDPARTDRKRSFVIEQCEPGGGPGGLEFEVRVPKPKHLFLDCGLYNSCQGYSVFFNQKTVLMRPTYNDDGRTGAPQVARSFTLWFSSQYDFTTDDFPLVMRNESHHIVICRREASADLQRLLVLE